MKRPEYQWYTSLGEGARRVSLSSREERLAWIESHEISASLARQIKAVINESPQRIEFFEVVFIPSSIVDQTSSSLSDSSGDLSGESPGESPRGWAIFTPDLQVMSVASLDQLDHSERSVYERSLIYAATSWLIARGSDTLALWINEVDLQLPEIDPDGVSPKTTLIDWLNYTLTLDHPPVSQVERLITLAPSNLEIIEAIGALDRIVACEDSSDLPQSHEGLIPRLGPDLNPDLDQVQGYAPELVISSLSVPGMERIITGLAMRRIPQLILAPRTIQDVCDDIERVADALNVTDQGQRVSQRLCDERDELIRQRDTRRARVYLEWWPKPMFTPGLNCFSNELIELAGGINIFKERAGSSVEITTQELVDARPDVCFISWCGAPYAKLNPDNLRSRVGLEQLNERARAHVTPIDEAYTGRPGPRMLEASRQMASVIQRILASPDHK